MRATLAPAAIFGVCLGYFLLFRHYGFQLEDEGMLLFQLARVANGQIPYVDFHTGYTPGYFYLGGAALAALGRSAVAIRTLMAVVNAASATALYVLARRFVGPWMAALPAILWAAFLPVFPGEFASFNVPYPAWVAALAWLGVALALVAWTSNARSVWLATAGICAAAAFAAKPNTGAFAIAGGVWVVALAGRRASLFDSAAGAAASASMVLGVWLAFGSMWWGMDAAVHLAPVAVIGVLAAGPLGGRAATASHARTMRALALFAAGFLVPTVTWALPMLRELGMAGFLREVLLVRAGVAEVYFAAHPTPEPYALALVAAAAGFAVAGRMARTGWLSAWAVAALAAGVIGAAALRIARSAVMPESLGSSVAWQLENAAFWLAPLAHWAGIVLLAASSRRAARSSAARMCMVLPPLAVAMYLQLYPRADFMHLITSVPVTLVLATVLLARTLAWWAAAPAFAPRIGARLPYALLAAATLTVVGVKLTPALQALHLAGRPGAAGVATATVTARVESRAADDLRAFGAAADFLVEHTRPGEPVLAFPALAGLLFAAQLTSPVPHDYWFPGRPGHAEEARMVAMLEAAPPRFIVTLNDGWTFFSGAPAYYSTARDFVVGHYHLAARFGRYDVLVERDAFDAAPPISWQPVDASADVLDPLLAPRRQAARRWMAALTLEQAHAAVLEEDTRTAILRLRALRDGGDLRAAGWLIAGLRHGNPRVREEAARSMQEVATRFRATRLRWADDLDLAAYRRYTAPYFDEARRLARESDERVRDFAAAVLSLE